jgi:chlorophyll synthase
MIVPQAIVAGLLAYWQHPVYATLILGLMALQALCMRRLLGDPKALAPWYNATGVTLYVLGMLAAAIAIRGGVT